MQVLPDYILAVMLIVLLVATAHRTLQKGIKSYNKETAAMQVIEFPLVSRFNAAFCTSISFDWPCIEIVLKSGCDRPSELALSRPWP